MAPSDPVRLEEIRVLDGANLYFTRPAVKLTLGVVRLIDSTDDTAAGVAGRVGMSQGDRPGQRVRVGPAGSDQHRRFVARLAAHLVRSLAAATRTNLAVRSRPGPVPHQIVV